MRLKEFIERIPTGEWHLRHSGAIRRGKLTDKPNSQCQCPISSLSGGPASAFRMVAQTHGLEDVLAERIAEAADNEYLTPTKRRIRRALLKRLFPAAPDPAV